MGSLMSTREYTINGSTGTKHSQGPLTSLGTRGRRIRVSQSKLNNEEIGLFALVTNCARLTVVENQLTAMYAASCAAIGGRIARRHVRTAGTGTACRQCACGSAS